MTSKGVPKMVYWKEQGNVASKQNGGVRLSKGHGNLRQREKSKQERKRKKTSGKERMTVGKRKHVLPFVKWSNQGNVQTENILESKQRARS